MKMKIEYKIFFEIITNRDEKIITATIMTRKSFQMYS